MNFKNKFLTFTTVASSLIGSEINAQTTASIASIKETTASIAKQANYTLTQSDSIPKQYKDFFEEYKNDSTVNKALQTGKLKLYPTEVELDGILFPNDFISYKDVLGVKGLVTGENVIEKGGHYYFTLDAVQHIQDAGYKIITTKDLKHILSVLGNDLIKISKLLNLPAIGEINLIEDQEGKRPSNNKNIPIFRLYNNNTFLSLSLEKNSYPQYVPVAPVAENSAIPLIIIKELPQYIRN